ncbi:MAG: arginine deiminase family protein [Candidatus Shapirobacteria bacterium]|nr:arginine deiminase family protein [Candidatus Shapirobacteria bacterium]MDD5073655.1 arginine deiminase family protein [Candidatus Shapirobacteria bacterium]MDD5481384.1 arginine deiminase family protein [Candidatus Shapirobacteria bacterium]
MTKIIKRVLLCPPDYFQIRYQINPWMKNGQVNKTRAKNQWLNLVNLCQKLSIRTETITPQASLPDMVFAADQGLIKDNSVILARFHHQQRRPETKIYQDWFRKQGFQLLRLPASLCFEGGDALIVNNNIFIGHGFRTSPQSPRAIEKLAKSPVIDLGLINPHFYHLDTCLFILNPKTAFYYPPAFDQTSSDKLAKFFSKLIPLTKKEAFSLTANSLNTDHQVIIQRGAPIFAQKLAQLGYRVHQVNVSEFFRSGGGIHCLTLTTQTN